MSERHTIDFDRFGVNILSDADRGSITLQFDTTGYGEAAIASLLRAVNTRFGGGIRSRAHRWLTGQSDLLLMTSSGMAHPDNPDVIRIQMAVREGERMDSALAALMDFFARMPGYQRTLGRARKLR